MEVENLYKAVREVTFEQKNPNEIGSHMKL